MTTVIVLLSAIVASSCIEAIIETSDLFTSRRSR